MRTKESLFTGQQLTIWNKLMNLKDEEGIIGRDLMVAPGIGDERIFYGAVEGLRLTGCASKGLHNPGYYEERSAKDAWDYQNVDALEREIERITLNTRRFFVDKHSETGEKRFVRDCVFIFIVILYTRTIISKRMKCP